MAYDPKRPRPKASTGETAPVDELLASLGAAEPVEPADPVEPAEPVELAEPAVEPVEPAAEQVISPAAEPKKNPQTNALKAPQASEVPVAAAPEEGTANRAVLLAVAGASLAVAAVLIIWSRRRGSTADD
jgi:outer membrane biosynthesis protein TonB